MDKPSSAAVAAALLLCAGCAGDGNPSLARAEAEYRAAAADPDVRAFAPYQLHEAETALGRARLAEASDADAEEVEHLAYIASRRAEIAQVSAERRESLSEAGDAQVEAEGLARQLAAVLTALQLRETDRGVVITVEDVHFDPQRASLREDALPDLARIADHLRAHPDLEVGVEGHADPTELDEGAAGDLSQARAEAVAGYFVGQGIDPDRIETKAFGASLPVAPEETAFGRKQNRRVEILVRD